MWKRIQKRKWKRSMIIKHHKNHWKQLLHGTLPIFVAASICRAVSSVLELAIGSGDIQYQIIVQFIYALFISHTLGYLVALNLTSTKLEDYYLELIGDNASFAWSSALTLVILRWLYSTQSAMISFVAWFFLLVLVIIIIYVANYIQVHYLSVSDDERERLRDFESQSFALAIAYSFSVIIAASIYRNQSSDYLSGTDDINPNDDNMFNGKNTLSWLFFFYTGIITIGMFLYQWFINTEVRKKHAINVIKALREEEDEEELEQVSVDEDDNEVSVEFKHQIKSDNFSNPQIVNSFEVFFFSWDTDRQCIEAYKCFYYTTIGYLVSSSWHIWSVLTFATLFKFPGGNVFGLFLFALLSTLLIAGMMTIVTVREELLGQSIDAQMSKKYVDHRLFEIENILYVTFGRLTVGWAWQEFFYNVITAMIPDSFDDSKIIEVIFKCLFAILVFFLGRKLERYLKKSIPISNISSESSLYEAMNPFIDERTNSSMSDNNKL